MFWTIREFFRDNKDIIKIIGGIVVMLAGALVMVYQILVGLLMIFAGMLTAILTISKIMRSGGINGYANAPTGGMGQQQSGVVKGDTPAVTEVTSDIWNTMTDDKPDK